MLHLQANYKRNISISMLKGTIRQNIASWQVLQLPDMQLYLTEINPTWQLHSFLYSSQSHSYLLLLVDLILYVPSTIFQLNRDGSSWIEPVLS